MSKPGELEIDFLDRFISENVRLTPFLSTPGKKIEIFQMVWGNRMETDYVAAYHQKGVAQPVLKG